MFVFRRIFALLPASSDTKTFSEDREKDFLKHKACPAIFCQANERRYIQDIIRGDALARCLIGL